MNFNIINLKILRISQLNHIDHLLGHKLDLQVPVIFNHKIF